MTLRVPSDRFSKNLLTCPRIELDNITPSVSNSEHLTLLKNHQNVTTNSFKKLLKWWQLKEWFFLRVMKNNNWSC